MEDKNPMCCTWGKIIVNLGQNYYCVLEYDPYMTKTTSPLDPLGGKSNGSIKNFLPINKNYYILQGAMRSF
jgi:hypothetical protein